jgi:hypothetical protein
MMAVPLLPDQALGLRRIGQTGQVCKPADRAGFNPLRDWLPSSKQPLERLWIETMNAPEFPASSSKSGNRLVHEKNGKGDMYGL